MIAIPTFGYKSHIVIDRRYGFIRKSAATSAAHSDGRMLPKIVTTDNASGDVWADSAYRSKANEAWLSSRVLRSQIHRLNPKAGRCQWPHHGPTARNRASALGSNTSSPTKRSGTGCSAVRLA
jgi:IS5 family transposase